MQLLAQADAADAAPLGTSDRSHAADPAIAQYPVLANGCVVRRHRLKGETHGRWAVSVNGNWRLMFEFQEGNVCVLDHEDYH